MGFVVLILAAAVVFWPNPKLPTSQVVLLPDANGNVGALIVKTATAELTLDKAYASAQVDGAGATVSGSEDAAKTRTRFEAVLAARPLAPRSFVVYFENGPAVAFIAAAGPVLDDLRTYLAAHPAPEITVIGHTDRVGSEASNDLLSLNRAIAVRDFLRDAGIKAQSIDISGRGEREPAVPTADEVAEAKNRRVEISVR